MAEEKRTDYTIEEIDGKTVVTFGDILTDEEKAVIRSWAKDRRGLLDPRDWEMCIHDDLKRTCMVCATIERKGAARVYIGAGNMGGRVIKEIPVHHPYASGGVHYYKLKEPVTVKKGAIFRFGLLDGKPFCEVDE